MNYEEIEEEFQEYLRLNWDMYKDLKHSELESLRREYYKLVGWYDEGL